MEINRKKQLKNTLTFEKVRSQEMLKKIKEKVQEITSYQPRVGVFGVTGVGKSSLCNALFGKDVAKVSDVASCTREPQNLFIGEKDRGITLIDVPGVGENQERDKEYFELYKKLTLELDLVIWVMKADDRAFSIPKQAYKEILKNHLEQCPVIFVINQVDKLSPMREWDDRNNKPGEKQQRGINEKIIVVSSEFDTSTNYIVPISVEEKYNLEILMEKIVHVVPKEKKYSLYREAESSIRTEKMEQEAEKGLWDTIKEFCGDVWDKVKEPVTSILLNVGLKWFNKLFR
ncbi:GTPase family protein [Xenorhabdus entomophaga]|uniref:GTPase family protein n=1 Tax=Xenorhabdus entomophaga TaxID=3136257 RepID=UPI0030F41B67